MDGRSVWTACAQVKNVHLPPNMFFGISAATTQFSDAHDVSFMRVSDGVPLTTRESEIWYELKEKEVSLQAFLDLFRSFIAARLPMESSTR